MTVKIGFLALSALLCAHLVAAADSNHSLDVIFGQIEQLENNSDPKCYATASRLEDFMFGTPLSDEARFAKNGLQKQWALRLWSAASTLAAAGQEAQIRRHHVRQAVATQFDAHTDDKGHWQLVFADGRRLRIHRDDKRQYSSIAYSLRALLAVQQDQLLASSSPLTPLAADAVDEIKHLLDLYTLAVLKIADNQARLTDQHQLSRVILEQIWRALEGARVAAATPPARALPLQPVTLTLLPQIIAQKIRSYRAYNDVNNQLFVRNLQVYFARSSWPKDAEEGKRFRQLFTETLIAFAGDLYRGAQKGAMAQGHATIAEADVQAFVAEFIPHRINEYEDAIFFPRLARSEQVVIEAYDMDAFRDSGIHWQYLNYAIKESGFVGYLEPDPFAAELLAENIAQFGVLLLRIAGAEGQQLGHQRLKAQHLTVAMKRIQQRLGEHGKRPVQMPQGAPLRSARETGTAMAEQSFFTENTAALGIRMQHRTSDWLNRLLRSYLPTGPDTGNITIPPAFGGGGIAAADVNNDKRTDLLILSGAGNRLYLNRGDHFEDVTARAGLDWRRDSNNQPGEPRQPLIADLDNDGWQDIVITYVDDSHRIYKNRGDGTFADVTDRGGLGGKGLVGGPATVFDYDNDGLLDIYITYFGDYLNGTLPTLKRRNSNGLPNKLFRNLGNFTFADVTNGSGLDDRGWGQAVTHTDLDGDGRQDLIVGNDFGVNGYYRNLGDGKFRDIASQLGTDKPSYTMNIGLTDLNDDLRPDVYISNIVTMNKDEKYVLPGEATAMKFNPDKLANMRVVEANDLFLSLGDNKAPRYESSNAVARGYSSTGWAWDADFFDFDNDGDDDLYVLNGMNEFNLYSSDNPYYTDPFENKRQAIHMAVSTKESNVFFVNGNGKLNNASRESGADLLSNSRSAVYLDSDNDGDLDMVLNNYHGPVVAYRNNSERRGNHWLKLKLTGAPEVGVNRDAIGARLIVTTTKGERIWREISGSTGYMSVHPKVQHVGLGQATAADVRILWPNGRESLLSGVKANQTLTVDYRQVVSQGAG